MTGIRWPPTAAVSMCGAYTRFMFISDALSDMSAASEYENSSR